MSSVGLEMQLAALTTRLGATLDRVDAAEARAKAAEAVIAEARSYYGASETAYVVKVLDGYLSKHSVPAVSHGNG